MERGVSEAWDARERSMSGVVFFCPDAFADQKTKQINGFMYSGWIDGKGAMVKARRRTTREAKCYEVYDPGFGLEQTAKHGASE